MDVVAPHDERHFDSLCKSSAASVTEVHKGCTGCRWFNRHGPKRGGQTQPRAQQRDNNFKSCAHGLQANERSVVIDDEIGEHMSS